jgi:microcystin degradation protein MlrC
LRIAVAEIAQETDSFSPLVAGGTISVETLRFLTEKLIAGLRNALPLDAVFLSLHGAATKFRSSCR